MCVRACVRARVCESGGRSEREKRGREGWERGRAKRRGGGGVITEWPFPSFEWHDPSPLFKGHAEINASHLNGDFSWWYFTANISGIGMCIFFPFAILNSGMVLVAGYSIFPSLHMQHSAASVVFCPWLHHQHHPLHSCTPHPVQIHLHPLMISVKNCWHRMRQGGGRRLIWIKLDRRVDTALKVSRPFMSRWQGVCVLGGSAWDCQRGLFESGRIFEAREWKGVDHKARHTSNTPRHIFTLSFPCGRRVYKEGGVSALWHGLQNMQHKIKHVDDKVDHRGLGVQKKGFPRLSFSGSLWFVQIKYWINSDEEASAFVRKFL